MFASQRGLGFLLVNGLAQHNVPLTTPSLWSSSPSAIVANTLMLRLGRNITHRG